MVQCRCGGTDDSGSLQRKQQVQLGLVLWPKECGSIPLHCCAAAALTHAMAVLSHAQCSLPVCLGKSSKLAMKTPEPTPPPGYYYYREGPGGKTGRGREFGSNCSGCSSPSQMEMHDVDSRLCAPCVLQGTSIGCLRTAGAHRPRADRSCLLL